MKRGMVEALLKGKGIEKSPVEAIFDNVLYEKRLGDYTLLLEAHYENDNLIDITIEIQHQKQTLWTTHWNPQKQTLLQAITKGHQNELTKLEIQRRNINTKRLTLHQHLQTLLQQLP